MPHCCTLLVTRAGKLASVTRPPSLSPANHAAWRRAHLRGGAAAGVGGCVGPIQGGRGDRASGGAARQRCKGHLQRHHARGRGCCGAAAPAAAGGTLSRAALCAAGVGSPSTAARREQCKRGPKHTSAHPSRKHTSPGAAHAAKHIALRASAVLEYHNRYRALHGAGALTWSANLQRSAAAYADKVRSMQAGPAAGVTPARRLAHAHYRYSSSLVRALTPCSPPLRTVHLGPLAAGPARRRRWVAQQRGRATRARSAQRNEATVLCCHPAASAAGRMRCAC